MRKTLVMPAIMSSMGVLGLTYQLAPSVYLHLAHGLHFIADACFLRRGLIFAVCIEF